MKNVPIVSALALTLLVNPSLADQVPHSGAFLGWPVKLKERPPDGMHCAMNFGVQGEAGSASSYHLDLTLFLNSGKIRYLPTSRLMCTYDGASRIEHCDFEFSIFGYQEAYNLHADPDTPDAVHFISLTRDGLDDPARRLEVDYTECPFGVEDIEPYLDAQASNYPSNVVRHITGTALLRDPDLAERLRAKLIEIKLMPQ